MLPGFVRKLLGKSLRRVLRRIIVLLARSAEELAPGTSAVLVALRDRGAKVYISSGSCQEDIWKVLRREGVSDCVSSVLGREIPKSQHISLFMSLSQLSQNEAAMVGDSPYDMEIARYYGLCPIGVASTLSPKRLTHAGAEMVVDNIVDLIGVH
jgi:phosphoglycolate phosphatase-like HAD superfamily hydrolase